MCTLWKSCKSAGRLLYLALLLLACLIPTLVYTHNVVSASSGSATASRADDLDTGSPALIVKTVDGCLHYVQLGRQLDRLTRLWSIDLGELVTSNLEDMKVEFGNVVNLYRIIPSLEGYLYKYSFSMSKDEPKEIDVDRENSLTSIENDYDDDDDDNGDYQVDIEDDDDDGDDDIDADTGTYYQHSKSKDSKFKRAFKRGSGSGRPKTTTIYNEAYERIPFDMDDLLKSTFLFNNDLTFTGSIHSHLVRVNHKNGKLVPIGTKKPLEQTEDADSEKPRIIPSEDGESSTPNPQSGDDIFVIKQSQYDLRAISIKNGTEKWNLKLIKNEIIKYPKLLADGSMGDQSTCFLPKKKFEQQLTAIENLLEFDVANGRLVIGKERSPDDVIIDGTAEKNSSLEFKNPIVGCELVYNGVAKHINIFAKRRPESPDRYSPSRNLINTSMKRASKSTTTGENDYDFMASTLKDNRSKKDKYPSKANAAAVSPWSSSRSVMSKNGIFTSRRNTIDPNLIYIGVYKNKFYAQNRYDPLYDKYIHLRQIFEDESSESARCSNPHVLGDDLKLISAAGEEDDFRAEEKTNALSVVVGDRKRDKIFAFLDRLKTTASSILSYGKLCRLLSTYFLNDHSNCNNLAHFEESAACRLDTQDEDDDDDDGEFDRHNSQATKYELTRAQSQNAEQRCDAKKSPSVHKKDRTNSSKTQPNTSHNDLRTILIIVVSTSFISIAFATFIFIKFNKRISGILFFKDSPEIMNSSSVSSKLNESIGRSGFEPSTPQNKFQFGEFFSSGCSGSDHYDDSGEQIERMRKNSSSSNCSGGSRTSLNRVSAGYGSEIKRVRRMTSSISDNSIADCYEVAQPPCLEYLHNSSKNVNMSVGPMIDDRKETVVLSGNLGNGVRTNRCNETPFLRQSTSKASSQLSIPTMTEMNDDELMSIYESRYLNEFQHIRLIGKGGFGYVFEAKHKIDERVFAIKRIKLKNNQNAKDRVLREVRTLAKLESPYIVRYFHSWFEYPPAAWQSLVDKKILFSKNLSNGNTIELNDTFNNTQFSIESNNTEDNSCDISNSFGSLSSSAQMNESTRLSEELGYNDDSLKNSKPKKKSTKRLKRGSKKVNSSSMEHDTTRNSDISISFSNSVEFQRDTETSGRDDDDDDTGSKNASKSTTKDQFDSSDDEIVFERSNESSSSSSSDDSDDSDSDESTDSIEQNDFTNETDSSCSIVFRNNDEADDAKLDIVKPQISKDDGFEEGSKESGSPIALRTLASRIEIEKRTRKDSHRNNQTPVDSGKSEFIYFYIQMELCKRETLRHWLTSNSKRDHIQILNIFEQILNAILYIHSNDMIHRDLKPSNIFLSLDGRTIKIGDFGLVISAEEHLADDENNATGSTSPTGFNNTGADGKETHAQAKKQPQDFDGTYLYMSPEQLKGLEYNSKVDIFSLGIILFELIIPFDTAMERYQTLKALNKCKFPEFFDKNYPIEKNLISLLIEPNPDKRLSAEQIQKHPVYLEFKSAYSV